MSHNSNVHKKIKLSDISGKTGVHTAYTKSPMKKWIKLIPANNTLSFKKYHRKNYFKLIADIVLDNEDTEEGNKKRNTLIRFDPKITKEEYSRKTEWIYLFVLNGQIVKIGGTRTGIKGRANSYLSGHYVAERGKAEDCSNTNGYIYNTFEFYLSQGSQIQLYGYELPKRDVEIDIFGKKVVVATQTFHAYESILMEDYKKKYGEYPYLSDNADPKYR